MIVRQSFRFEAAHRLPLHRGRCVNFHGHSYRFTITLERPVDPASGMTIDFGDIASVVESKVIEGWDHQNLNDFLENPTAEKIVMEIWSKIAVDLPDLREIELWEMPESSVVYRGGDEPR